MNVVPVRRGWENLIAWSDRATTRRAAVWVFSCAAVTFALVPVLHAFRGQSIKDYELWYQTGQLAWHGREIYPDMRVQKFDFMYPPSCALFLAPVSALGQIGLIVALVFLNAAAWIGSMLLSVRLADGKKESAPLLLYLVPNAIVLLFVWGNFLLGQPTLLLLALMLAAFAALQCNRQITAGALIGLAAGIKAFPVVAILYLLYRRYWIAAASLAATLTLLLVAFPIAARGSAQAGTDLHRWTEGMLFKYDEKGFGQRAGRSHAWKNQSIFGVANLLLRHVDYDDKYEPHRPVYANVADLGFSTVNKLIGVTTLLAGLIYVAVLPGRRRRTAETDAIEFALLLLLMLVFTPFAFGYLFAWLLYPFTVLTRRLMFGRSPLLLFTAIGAVALLALTIPFRIQAQVYGNIFFATILLFVGLSAEFIRLQRMADDPVKLSTSIG